ncbi:MAG: prepilin peptidase [Patescibacteria group bacterium]
MIGEFTLILFFSFALGLFVGSFLNVVILRFGTGLPISTGRSKCFSCSATLKWHELMPVFSFLFLKGKCRACHSKISYQYFLVELITGLIFASLTYLYSIGFIQNFLLLMAYILIGCILLSITVYDLRHKIIPDTFVFIFITLSFLVGLYRFFDTEQLSLIFRIINLGAGPILFLPFYGLWKYSEGRWIGLGDGKLVVGIGFLLNLAEGISAVVIAFWIGALWAILYLSFQKITHGFSLWQGRTPITMKSEIPFAPFLIISTILVFLYPIDLFSLHLLLGI